ncbi:MAG TPA: hypothetical protein VFO66_13960 [Gemmatimonadaceae bacterium]|nr:hypothetical protein [Gemmatimonadaceae bacterium]
MEENVVAVVSVVCIFVLFPLALGVTRYIWKRASDSGHSRLSDDAARRMEHMQQSIDAMAVELERISENQRFVTKLLAEREKAPRELRP